MATQPYRKVDRNEVYSHIKRMIEKNENKQAEISSSELADRFDVQAPTMDYHLNRLLEEGYLELAKERGKYNRKIYRLPKGEDSSQEKKRELVFDDVEKFKEILQQKLREQEEEAKAIESVQEEPVVEKQPTPVAVEVEERPEPVLEHRDLTLDDRIELFIQQSKNVTSANDLLSRDDKEVLSVVSESIQQQMVYLKDLSEQLSTVQNKTLVQGLIDDRNNMMERLNRAEEENRLLRHQLQENQGKYDIDPNRVRQMHQIIISTLDSYLDQPNHALALGRHEFRKNVSKEVSDLAKYVLNIAE